ncbi:DUF3305 domain-containing protein [Oxalobacteraceae bacterium OM1]|nr:DUF3305 domain-containing protein [Oxalobacteraceae bacterium OM1]
METGAPTLAIVMQRTPLQNRWQPYRWQPLEVTPAPLPHAAPHLLREDEADTRWLFPGFPLELHRDEAEGYYLNVSSPHPCWFIMWRLEDLDGREVAVPKTLTLSYNEAARLMDGGERVDTLPLPAEVLAILAAYTQEHYTPEAKKKRRKPSFEGGEGVAQMARAEGERDGS